jgi:rod shape-determining protein MreC
MVEESNKAAWIVLVSVLFLHLLLVSLPEGRPRGTGFGRALLMDALTPAERLVDRSLSGIRSVWTGYFALAGVGQENEALREEIGQLRMEIQANSEAVLEAERLRRYLSLGDIDAGVPLLARVTGGDPSFSQRTVMLDKGSAAGIGPASPVRTPDGIAGRVIHLSRSSSVVQLITDPLSAVGALVGENRVQGLVRGNGTSELVLEHPEDGVELVPGQVVLTSGSERIYPKGLPIGVVVSVRPADRGPADLVNRAVVRPLADLTRLEEVLVLVSERSDPSAP